MDTFSKKPTNLVTPEGQTYFGQVIAEYLLLPPPLVNSTDEEKSIRSIADAIVKKEAEQRTCAELFELETCVVKLEPEADLRRRAWAIRAKFRDLAGETEYESYRSSSPPEPKTGDDKELRADTAQLLAEFHWIYAFAPVRERMRNSLGKRVFWLTSTFVSIAFAITAWAYWRNPSNHFDLKISSSSTVPVLPATSPPADANIGSPPGPTTGSSDSPLAIPVLPIIIAMGMVGGYISLQRRIQAAPSTGDPIVSLAELSNSSFSVYLAPISGAVFASLLYIIFIGGLLTGPLFPVVSTPEGRCEIFSKSTGTVSTPDSQEPGKKSDCMKGITFVEFVSHTGPASGKDFAVLLVWVFIAGFAERFVPDTLDRLVSQAEKK